ncbi:MAG: hypothetical protein MO852_03370 [Candidatus Devosia euplotis]|nr:hypothetical protein [Candidatus Devosia euplotis]
MMAGEIEARMFRLGLKVASADDHQLQMMRRRRPRRHRHRSVLAVG